jgi:hypothetical protein
MFANSVEGTQMSKKQKQSKKATKSSKRTKVAAKPEDETDTAAISGVVEAPQATPTFPEAEVPVEPQQIKEAVAPTAPVTESGTAPKATRSDAAKANIKQGLKQHALAGRPTKEQLILVFGTKGYAMTWAQRTARYGITPETFQAALAKGVPAIRLGPGAQTVVEKTKGTA